MMCIWLDQVSCLLLHTFKVYKLFSPQSTQRRTAIEVCIKAMIYRIIPCQWVPVTTAWRVLRLRMEERPPIWRVAANKLNKQSRTADKG